MHNRGSDMKHADLLIEIASVVKDTEPAASILAVMQAIKDAFPEFYWVGVYILHGDELRLGPFVGPATDHVRIPVGRGVCGTAVATGRNQLVDDVRELENYLACNLQTRSEIVVLVRDPATTEIIGQIDIDCTVAGRFGARDEAFLDEVATLIAPAMTMLRG